MLTRGPDGRVEYTPEEGEIVVLRRAHACGGDRFAVTLVGLDVRLSCTGCGRRVTLGRERLRGRVVDVAGHVTPDARGGAAPDPPGGPAANPGPAPARARPPALL